MRALHDLVIRNGKIVDGSGKKPFHGDVAIDCLLYTSPSPRDFG